MVCPLQFAFYAAGAASSLAMVDYPYPCGFMSPLPANPVQAACAVLLQGGGSDEPVVQIARLATVALQYVNASGDLPCFDLDAELVGHPEANKPAAAGDATAGSGRGRSVGKGRGLRSTGVKTNPTAPHVRSSDLGVTAWNYQACTELPLEPITSDGFGFYPPGGNGTGLLGSALGSELGGSGGGLGGPGQTAEVVRRCAQVFGVEARPFFLPLAFGRGGDYSDPARGLANVLFVENSKDPWHVGTATVSSKGGVGGSVVRFLADGGAHHQDLRFSSPYDSPGVHAARRLENEHIRAWLGGGLGGGLAGAA